MKNVACQDNPLLLIYEARLRRRQRFSRLCGLFVSIVVTLSMLPLLREHTWNPLAATLGTWLVLATSLIQLSKVNVVAESQAELGSHQNMEELVASGMTAAEVGDSGGAFLAKYWRRATPWMLLGALLIAHPVGSSLVLGYWVVQLPLGWASVYAATVQILLRDERIRLSSLLRMLLLSLPWLVLAAVSPLPVLLSQPHMSWVMCAWFPLVMLAMQIQGALVCRRMVIDWLQNGTRSDNSMQVRQRAQSAWSRAWNRGNADPLLYRYQVTRMVLAGVPLWFAISSLLGLLAAALLAANPGMGLLAMAYLLLGSAGHACFAHLRFLQQELRSGGYEQLLATFTRRELVDGLAQVGCSPRVPELAALLAPPALTALLVYPQHATLTVVTLSLVIGLMLVLGTLSSYVNVFCLLQLKAWNKQHLLWNVAPGVTTACLTSGFFLTAHSFTATTRPCGLHAAFMGSVWVGLVLTLAYAARRRAQCLAG